MKCRALAAMSLLHMDWKQLEPTDLAKWPKLQGTLLCGSTARYEMGCFFPAVFCLLLAFHASISPSPPSSSLYNRAVCKTCVSMCVCPCVSLCVPVCLCVCGDVLIRTEVKTRELWESKQRQKRAAKARARARAKERARKTKQRAQSGDALDSGSAGSSSSIIDWRVAALEAIRDDDADALMHSLLFVAVPAAGSSPGASAGTGASEGKNWRSEALDAIRDDDSDLLVQAISAAADDDGDCLGTSATKTRHRVLLANEFGASRIEEIVYEDGAIAASHRIAVHGTDPAIAGTYPAILSESLIARYRLGRHSSN